MNEIDIGLIISHLYHLAIAFVLVLPIGWEREKHFQGAGLRTFPLVAVASCGFMLVGISVFPDAHPQARVMTGLITGIGFIGGGAIIKGSEEVSGVSTAASIWTVGAVGAAVAWNHFEIAIVLSVINYLTLALGRQAKKEV